MKDRHELLEIVSEADKDVGNGRVAPIQDTFVELRGILEKKGGLKYEIIRSDSAAKVSLISELNAGFASGEEERWISDDEVAEHFENRRRMVKG
ncbi:hypothetical protein [Butyrivibrio sp. AE3003]|uniref:hypothetical protein n=1 Tax=Butyrivibrio sp. AE3003 TaxID=1496721 RepID=UPI000691D3BA|nr:hypothetical protein [Butyrivibrio sp. AE3003]MBR4358109.1 hypothetical protein [Butyrivibrio sp.]MBR4639868.1 hypothetical protein [Butyrivibrio sp.]